MNPIARQAALDAANRECAQLGAAILIAFAIWLVILACVIGRRRIAQLPARVRLWRIDRAHRANLQVRPLPPVRR